MLFLLECVTLRGAAGIADAADESMIGFMPI